jgi:hypothetical protein
MAFASGGGLDVNRQIAGWWVETNVGQSLVLNKTGTGNVRGSFTYILI